MRNIVMNAIQKIVLNKPTEKVGKMFDCYFPDSEKVSFDDEMWDSYSNWLFEHYCNLKSQNDTHKIVKRIDTIVKNDLHHRAVKKRNSGKASKKNKSSKNGNNNSGRPIISLNPLGDNYIYSNFKRSCYPYETIVTDKLYNEFAIRNSIRTVRKK
ncbi:hypothetical protein QWY85_15930 [Neolewinella lacunae]|uniref:Uncharacterized protein n=1 Tax=Neolewinella lacunae TaxID=1517758 RepID=A0A923TCC2_9BACT|nr:hypothetical protein [Neolewinella lacunae]MBC6993567.1 hypothetical protein [Neolewinella lacunae]MDN3636157.1 hypothetical protein [Neolewinella lacunae]